MGAVKVDMHKKERWYDEKYALDNPFGVRHVFEDYEKLVEIVQLSSDYDALNVLIDFEKALEVAKLTDKQKNALEYVYYEKYTQEETAELLGYADHTSISKLIDRALTKVAESQGYDEEAFYEKHGH